MVSVLMAAHRDDGYVWRTIESVLSQQGVDFEFIIVANNCDDVFFEKLKKLDDPRIRLHRTKIPQLAFNLNYGLNEAQFELVARIDSDDLMLSGRLKAQADLFAGKPSLCVLGTQAILIDENDREIGLTKNPLTNEEIRRSLVTKSPFCHPSIMYRKSYILKNGAYLGGFQSEDYDLWLRLSENADCIFENTHEAYLKYRKHSNSAQGSPRAYAEVAGHFLKMSLLFRKPKYFEGLIVAVIKSIKRAIQ